MEYRVKDDAYQIADLQTKMLEVLAEFIHICKENGLRYWACGGTLIGAVRHSGFIPWDDDLDVFMPREDYEKLWALRDTVNTGDRFRLTRTTREKNYHHRVMQLVDCKTTFINCRSVNEDIEHGVYIDIIPMDGCAPKGIRRVLQIADSVLYSVYNIQCLPEFHGGRLYRLVVGTLLKLVPNEQRRYKIWQRHEKRMTCYSPEKTGRIVELAASVSVLLHPYPAEWFATTIPHPFENLEIEIPVGYDAYLKQVFGNYMELPPEASRHPRHNTVLIDLGNGYEMYRGKVYFLKDE